MPSRPSPSDAPLDALRRLPARVAAGLILVYRYGISPLLGPRCRFHPSCSAYGLEALGRFGLARGLWLLAARLVRCHPWHPGGVDPVPERFEPPGRPLGRVLRDAPHRPGRALPCPCDVHAAPDARGGAPSPSP